MRAVCKALSDEQHKDGGRKTGMGRKLHPLHGMHLRMPGRVHRIQKRQQKAPALPVRKIVYLGFYLTSLIKYSRIAAASTA